ncbi:hypothetical protein HYV89_04525 [Candidatus Woesearchaeota archaeon]|nr:hypothetical protein [Candidatus Woesearchaeota archaeon]
MAKQEIKVKKKHWYSILPTPGFRIPEIGETLTSDPSKLVGKTVTMTGMDLLHDPKKQNVKITFRITEIKDNKALTEIKGYQIMPSSIKRMMHPGKSKVDQSFKLETKDNIAVVAKPVLITKSKTTKGVLSKIRKNSEEFLRAAVKKQSYQENIHALLEAKLQVQLREHLKKIYPVTGCQIRIFEKQ